ncbi:MAG: transglutaminase-like domain-containing protein, partial [Candidatus Faecousia sp.]|nr:transglutaminase-like domain-containing protein [Candidatus Faecousia sp.]
MKQKLFALFLILSMLLSGCAWLDGSYVHVTPHQAGGGGNQGEALSAENYSELLGILKDMVAAGKNDCVIYTGDFDGDAMNRGLKMAGDYIRVTDPIGAYAVEDITFEQGASSGKPAVAVSITYRRTSAEIQRILRLTDTDAAQPLVQKALQNCDSRLVMLIEEYRQTDFDQLVQNLALAYPESVMETPQTVETVYGKGSSRVVELSFTYENSRDNLRQMQTQVRPVFDSAALYVSGDGADSQKFGQLYAFLMERFEYKLETSITPAYSLLRHGVGDSRAFATVYAAMCRMAGLECRIVTGTRQGEPWTWNLVWDNGKPYHVDLLA